MSLLTSWMPAGTPADPYLPDVEAPVEPPVADATDAATPSATIEPPPARVDLSPATAPPAASEGSTPARTTGSRAARRAAQRAEENARRRGFARRAAIIAVPLLAIFALIVAAVTLLGGGSTNGADGAADGRTQRTLLVQVTGDSGLAVDSVILGRALQGPDVTGLLIPTRTLTQAPGVGSVTVGETGRLPNPGTAGDALSDQLGVVVDGVWRIDREGLAAVVNTVGGISLSVDRDVMDSEGRVLVPAGADQRLDGVAAARYATYLGQGEQEQSRSARFGDVLTAWLATAPADASALEPVIASAGPSAKATLSTAEVADFFVPLAVAARGDGLALSSLPVKPIDTGADQVSYRVDVDAAQDSVQKRFAGSLPALRAGGEIKVLVQNGVGTPGLGQDARAKLVAADMVFVSGGNATKFGRERSAVVIQDSSPASRERGRAVAQALGLPDSAVRLSDRGQSVADVVVVLGKDFTAS